VYFIAGMTECCGKISMSMVHSSVVAGDGVEDIMKLTTSSGQAFGQVDLRLIDGEGSDAPWDEGWCQVPKDDDSHHGEVRTRGLTVFQGYFKSPHANVETFQDGWFRTGDVAVPVW
jgi:long-subunit acyl-CoA synthetase (AMP-forming)